MAIVYPVSLPSWLNFSVCEFNPPLAPVENAPTRGDSTIVRQLGPALWTADFTTATLTFDNFVAVRAFVDLLENGLQTFWAADIRRPYFKAYPNGYGGLLRTNGIAFDGTATLSAVASDNKTITLTGLPNGFSINPGDPLSFSYSGASQAYHRAAEQAVAGINGNASFEVRPHIRPGWTAQSIVYLANAKIKMVMLPNSYSPQLGDRGWRGTISWKGVQTLR